MTHQLDDNGPEIHISRIIHHLPMPHGQSTDGRVIYAVGDVHGCYFLLRSLLQEIVDDIAHQPDTAVPMLIFCGDYVDRGTQSAAVLAALVWLRRHATLDVVILRGNHESMLLSFIQRPDLSLAWLEQEGANTLAAYGVAMPDEDGEALEDHCRALRDELIDRMPTSHMNLLRSLPTSFICGDYVFVHAGLRPGVRWTRQSERDFLWIRDEFIERDYRFEKTVVHGHTWSSDKPSVTANRIGIDTGAYSTGVLTAVRLDEAGIEFFQARENEREQWSIKTLPPSATVGERQR